jgi:hypothetical protein
MSTSFPVPAHVKSGEGFTAGDTPPQMAPRAAASRRPSCSSWPYLSSCSSLTSCGLGRKELSSEISSSPLSCTSEAAIGSQTGSIASSRSIVAGLSNTQGFDCGYRTVSEKRSSPDGRTIRLAVPRARATSPTLVPSPPSTCRRRRPIVSARRPRSGARHAPGRDASPLTGQKVPPRRSRRGRPSGSITTRWIGLAHHAAHRRTGPGRWWRSRPGGRGPSRCSHQ